MLTVDFTKGMTKFYIDGRFFAIFASMPRSELIKLFHFKNIKMINLAFVNIIFLINIYRLYRLSSMKILENKSGNLSYELKYCKNRG